MTDIRPAAHEAIDSAIGESLRELRERRGLSARQLAGAAHVSAAMVSRIENGQVSPSIAMLNALSRALEVPLVSLFRGATTPHADCTLVRKGNGLVSTRREQGQAHEFVNLAAHDRRDLQFEARTITLARQPVALPTRVGHGVIFLYALLGSALFAYGRDEYLLEAGDSLSLDAELEHGFRQVLSEQFTFLSVQAQSRR